jgi:hypothetical protein
LRCAGVDAGRSPSKLRINKPRPYRRFGIDSQILLTPVFHVRAEF